MGTYIVQRLLGLGATLVVLSMLVFALVHMLPGDPAQVVAGVGARPEDVARIRTRLGLDQPLHIQYAQWAQRILRGDLGRSAITGEEISAMIGPRFVNTLRLAVAGICLATCVGILLGVVAAVRQNTIIDYITTTLAILGISFPVFWLGILLVIVFSITLRWLPAGGTGGVPYMVLPAVTLAANSTAVISRMTRSSMLEVLRKDFIRTAHAKGVRSSLVILRHGLRNAAIPILTVIGLQFGVLMGGAVLTESVFDWSGLGRMLVDAVFKRDFPLIQVLMLIFGGSFALVNLLVDLAYGIADPRMRY